MSTAANSLTHPPGAISSSRSGVTGVTGVTGAVPVRDPLLARFGACTDELHQDLELALKAARSMGMAQVELLECWDTPVISMTGAQLDRVRALLDAYEMSVSSVGSMFLKPVLLGGVRAGGVAAHPPFREHMEMLRASIRAARLFGAPMVRAFSFRRDDMVGLGNPSPRLPRGGEIPVDMLDKIAEGLTIAAREAADAGLILGLENVRSCWANTGHNTARIVEAVGHPALKVIWDPGNDFVSGGVPYPDGYEAVRPHVCHVHVKDARLVDASTGLTAWEAVGRGEVDYAGQFDALRRDGFAGTLSLETHWCPTPDRIENSRISFEGVRQALRIK